MAATQERNAKPTSETCENCGKAIGKLEEPWLHEDRVVCAECWKRLSGTSRRGSMLRFLIIGFLLLGIAVLSAGAIAAIVLRSLLHPKPEIVLLPNVRTFNHSAEIKKEDSKFDKSFSWNLSGCDIKANLMLSAFVSIDKVEPLQAANVVDIGFSSFSERAKYDGYCDLQMMLDGKIVDFGPVRRSSSLSGGSIHESLWTQVPLDKFARIVNSNKVEARLQSDEFEIPENCLEALRDLASRIPDGKTMGLGRFVVKHKDN